MKAIVWTAYGPPEVLEYRDVPTPAPGDHEVLVKVSATTVFAGDCELRGFRFPASFWIPLRLMFGLTKPRKSVRIPGQELSGEIVETGSAVTGFKPGDRVFAPLEMLGAYAEYVCLDVGKRCITLKPGNMSFEEAATVPVGGLNALHFIRKAGVRAGDRVLLNGAAGSIGTFAVQLAKNLGAVVTAVDSTGKLEMLRSIGADQLIDYTREDYTRRGETWDVIIDIVGTSPYSRTINCLTPNGRFILGNPRFSGFFKGLWTSWTSSKKVIAAMAAYRAEDLDTLKDFIEQGKLRTVIDRRFSLEHIVEAHRYVESGQKTGHVALHVDPVKAIELG